MTQPAGARVSRRGNPRAGGFPGANNASITNRPTCGGDKKAGLAPRIGTPINILATRIYSAQPPNCCRMNAICGVGKWGTILNRPVQQTRTPYANW